MAAGLTEVAREAYRAGAVNVDVLWRDSGVERARLVDGSVEASEELPYTPKVLNRAAARGDSVLTIVGEGHAALRDVDSERLHVFNTKLRGASAEFFKSMMSLDFVWTVAAAPSRERARQPHMSSSKT